MQNCDFLVNEMFEQSPHEFDFVHLRYKLTNYQFDITVIEFDLTLL